MLLKVVIAEDNDLFRKELVNEISAFEGFEIVYSTNNGTELLESVKKIKPQIVITDIDMPNMTGIEAIRAIRKEIPNTEIIFITAYDEYIKQAIELYAFDFIEKPVNIERLKETLERIKRRIITNDKLIEFKIDGSVKLIKVNDLCFVEALRKKTKISTEHGEYICNFSLKEVEEVLTDKMFFKTSRSYIVNLRKVRGIEHSSGTSSEIKFEREDYVAYVSRKNYDEFRKQLKQFYN